MVYDVPRNFVGDAHWKAEELLQDGDEVMLEKDGVIVHVAESVGRTETDLTELRNSKKKGSSEKGSSSPLQPAQGPAHVVERAGSTLSHQLKHRSLNALLGTPKGPTGKAALPTKSPFEERSANIENEGWPGRRPPKRQRVEQPPAWSVTRTSKNVNPRAKPDPPLWARTADSAKKKRTTQMQKGQQTLGTKEIIDISEDVDEHDKFLPGFSSDALAPSSPPRGPEPTGNRKQKQPPVRSSSPAFQTQKFSTTVSRPCAGNATNEPEEQCEIAHHDVARSALLPNENVAVPELPKDDIRVERSIKARSEPNANRLNTVGIASPRLEYVSTTTSGQTLRMATSAPKKKALLCQDQLSKKPVRQFSANTESAIEALLDVTAQDNLSTEAQPKTQQKQLQERLAKKSKKTANVENKRVTAGRPAQLNHAEADAALMNGTSNVPGPGPRTPLEQSALELARLDQMIMPPNPSPPVESWPPAQESRPLRRVVSEPNKAPKPKPKRVPGAPVRITPSPVKTTPSAASTPGQPEDTAGATRPTKAQQPKSRAKKQMQRAVSLNTTANGTSTVIFSKPFRTPKSPEIKTAVPEKPPDPWSREAFDLFTYRPPGWDDERWCFKEVVAN